MTEIISWILALPAPLIWLILLCSSGIEYVVPPFPGDVIVLGGGILTASRGFHSIPVFLAVTTGSVLGAALDYHLGSWLARPGNSWLHRWYRRPRVRQGIDRVCRGFARHGDAYLLVNRFLPGIRAFFFIAAGLVGLGRRRTLALAAVAALFWNGMLLVVGIVIGANIEALVAFAHTYSRWMWMGMALLAVLFALSRLAFWLWKRRRSPSHGKTPGTTEGAPHHGECDAPEPSGRFPQPPPPAGQG